MTAIVPFLRLPVMHRELTHSSLNRSDVSPEDAPQSLWPGLPDMPKTGWWSPEYPFTPEEAGICLADMCAMGEAALSGVPLQALAARDASPAAARSAEELEDLSRFARTGTLEEVSELSPSTLELTRRAAQKALLWAWLLEERALEVRALAQTYATGAARLADTLGVEHEEGEMPQLAALNAHTEAHLEEDPGLLPPWRTVLENATLFLPARARILVDNADMAADLDDVLDFAPASDGGREAEAPLWKALGRTTPRPGCPWQNTALRFVLREDR